MSRHFAGWEQLPDAERAELRARASASDLEALELAIAELSLAGLGELETPPAAVMRRLAADASTHVQRAQAPAPRVS
jgi:hypothetical protein